MPLYEYECEACGTRFEQIHQKFSDPPAEVCPHCGKGPVVRLLSSPAIQFKGSGWYITDYAKKGDTSDKSESKGGESKGDSEKAEKSTTTDKADTKAEKSETKAATETKSSSSETGSSSSSSSKPSSGAKD